MALIFSCVGTAFAVDILDRDVRFAIAASPLAQALVEFSTQSGVQVSAADADIAILRSSGLNGTYPVHEALSKLLAGSDLEISRVGSSTVAIHRASSAESTASAPPSLPDPAVGEPEKPSARELADDSVDQFILHHATVHYAATGVLGGLGRWQGGRPESICPVVGGLKPAYNAYITARVRALAAAVGVPTQSEDPCKPNLEILFTTEPQKIMNTVLKKAAASLGIEFPHQEDKLLANSSTHAVQGWYFTTGGRAILNVDASLIGRQHLLPLWPLVIPTGINGDRAATAGVLTSIMVVDTSKLTGYSIATIADYLAMLSFTIVQEPDHCDPLPSILDLMASNCHGREAPTAITAGDLAFLKALYYNDGTLGRAPTRDDIRLNMLRQFNGGL